MINLPDVRSLFSRSSPRGIGFAGLGSLDLTLTLHTGEKREMSNFWTKINLSCLQQWQPHVNDKLVRQGCGFVRADGCGECGPDWLPQGRLQPPHMCVFLRGNLYVVSSAVCGILHL